MQHPVPRKWLKLENEKEIETIFTTQGKPVTIMTYNILAQALVNLRERFKNCPKPAAKWSFRRQNLLKEIVESNADVVCLQECDYYNEFWCEALKKAGYSSFHKRQRKTDNYENFMPYGITIAFKTSKLKLVKYEDIEYRPALTTPPTEQQAQETASSLPTASSVGNALFDHHQLCWQANVAQLLALELIAEEPTQGEASSTSKQQTYGFVVTNTHTFYRWDHTFTRLRQLVHLLERAIVFSRQVQSETNSSKMWPILSCGDFNLTPDAINYKLLTKERKLDEEYLMIPRGVFEESYYVILEHYRALMQQESASSSALASSQATPATSTVQPAKEGLESEEAQQIKRYIQKEGSATVKKLLRFMDENIPLLESSYKTHSFLNEENESQYNKKLWWGEPPYSNYVDTYKATLDFIFTYHNMPHSGYGNISNQYKEGVLPTRIVQVPNLEELEPIGIPNAKFSSDHVPLMTELYIMPQ